MIEYLVMRIVKGGLRYEDVIKKYPDLKKELDTALEGRVHGNKTV